MNGMLQCGSKIYPDCVIVKRGVDHPVANNKVVILIRSKCPIIYVYYIDNVAEFIKQFDDLS